MNDDFRISGPLTCIEPREPASCAKAIQDVQDRCSGHKSPAWSDEGEMQSNKPQFSIGAIFGLYFLNVLSSGRASRSDRRKSGATIFENPVFKIQRENMSISSIFEIYNKNISNLSSPQISGRPCSLHKRFRENEISAIHSRTTVRSTEGGNHISNAKTLQ